MMNLATVASYPNQALSKRGVTTRASTVPISATAPTTILHTLVRATKLLREASDQITPQQMQMLWEIALRPGLTQQELASATGLNLSSISRNLMALGEWHRLGKKGLEFVETTEDPNERRRQIAFLTTKGRTFVRRMLKELGADGAETWEAPTAREYLTGAYSSRRRG